MWHILCPLPDEVMKMTAKTDTEVIIGGKVFTLSGYESEEYLQKIALYINNKMAEYNKIDSFRRQSVDTRGVLMQLNIADDYFKAKKQISVLEEEKEAKIQEIDNLKHDLIASKIKLDSLEKAMKAMQDEISTKEKEIIRLETNRHDKAKSGK